MKRLPNVRAIYGKNRKVTPEMELMILTLGKWGYSADFIKRTIWVEAGVTICLSTIHRYLTMGNTRIRDYRNGDNSEAKSHARNLLSSQHGHVKSMRGKRDSVRVVA